MMTTDLVRFPISRKALADATFEDLPEIATAIDYAEAAKVAARRAGQSEDAQKEWSKFSLEAQRRAGELLAVMPKRVNRHGGSSGDTVSPLRDVLGGSNADAKQKSKRWQDVAAVPEEVFTDYLEKSDEPTRSRLLRIGRDHVARKERESAPEAAPTDTIDTRTGDFREVLGDLSGVDAIITDPPYPKEYLGLLDDLALFADRVLAPDGVLAVMFGQTWLPEVYQRLSGGRPYRWTICYSTPGASYVSQGRSLTSNWKPVLVYGKGPRFNDVITGNRDDKSHHHWGQDYSGTAELVTRLTTPGAHVVDPFLGGGTMAVACRNLGRRFTGSDIDPEAVSSTRRRLLQ